MAFSSAMIIEDGSACGNGIRTIDEVAAMKKMSCRMWTESENDGCGFLGRFQWGVDSWQGIRRS